MPSSSIFQEEMVNAVFGVLFSTTHKVTLAARWACSEDLTVRHAMSCRGVA